MGAEHILSLSYGKDSLACLGAIEELGWPLDKIFHVEVYATEIIPADLPSMVEFKKKADKIIKMRYGIDVEHISNKNYEYYFYKKRKKGKTANQINGFPMVRGAWCNSRLKTNILNMNKKPGSIFYIGIASDEPKRFHCLTESVVSPLVATGWTETMCREWCMKNDLLSPIYTTATRGGCWFCHNQGVEQLRLLRKNYPDLWALLLKWDKDSPVSFHADGHTVHDFDKRFELEDLGLIYPDEPFRWRMIDEDLNLRWF